MSPDNNSLSDPMDLTIDTFDQTVNHADLDLPSHFENSFVPAPPDGGFNHNNLDPRLRAIDLVQARDMDQASDVESCAEAASHQPAASLSQRTSASSATLQNEPQTSPQSSQTEAGSPVQRQRLTRARTRNAAGGSGSNVQQARANTASTSNDQSTAVPSGQDNCQSAAQTTGQDNNEHSTAVQLTGQDNNNQSSTTPENNNDDSQSTAAHSTTQTTSQNDNDTTTESRTTVVQCSSETPAQEPRAEPSSQREATGGERAGLQSKTEPVRWDKDTRLELLLQVAYERRHESMSEAAWHRIANGARGGLWKNASWNGVRLEYSRLMSERFADYGVNPRARENRARIEAAAAAQENGERSTVTQAELQPSMSDATSEAPEPRQRSSSRRSRIGERGNIQRTTGKRGRGRGRGGRGGHGGSSAAAA